jgi:pilus assembly protein CpaF
LSRERARGPAGVEDEVALALRRRLAEEAQLGGDLLGEGGEALRERVTQLIAQEAEVLDGKEREAMTDQLLSRALGLGPLEPLLEDPEIEEVMVNGPDDVRVERAGRIERTEVVFDSTADLVDVIERILSPLGRRVDEASPLVDARLPDGSRVNCVIPPISLEGPVMTIRRFRRRRLAGDDLVRSGACSAELWEFLSSCVRARLNIVVSGGAGAGKTTLLNVLSSQVPPSERIVTIEDAAELQLRQDHVLRLESRPPNLEGEGEVTIRALVRNALRMRPDRIVVGEVRGREALDMLQALNTGHDGSMTTVHANSAPDAMRRIETLALMADVALPHAAVRDQVASALDLVVHVERTRTGERRMSAVGEVVRIAGDVGVRELYAIRDDVSARVALPTAAVAAKIARAG